MPRGHPSRSADRPRLLARIHRRYATTCQAVRIGSLEFPFTRIADPNRVLDEVADEADRRERATGLRADDEHLHLPYWAELWDSAMGIAQWLVRRAGHVEDTASPRPCVCASAVLDLGCGMGLCGTVAAALGARVLFADVEPPALLFARLNSLPWARRVTTRRINWRTDQIGRTFNLILGADILYEKTQWEFLNRFWRDHLAPGGAVVLAEPGRQTGDLFAEWIASRGWNFHRLDETVPSRHKPIRIFILS